MNNTKTAAIILAAGAGTRMRSTKPKVMHEIGGLSLITHVLNTVREVEVDRVLVVIGEGMPEVAAAVAPATVVVQSEPRGTAHAVMAAQEQLRGFVGDVLVLFGDTPFITKQTLVRVLNERKQKNDPAAVVLGFSSDHPGAYGRLVIDQDGELERIVEARDATAEQLRISLCNSGIMALDGKRMYALLNQIGDSNAQGEFYLTDVVGIAKENGFRCTTILGDETELLGVNSRDDLARLERVYGHRSHYFATTKWCRTERRKDPHAPFGKPNNLTALKPQSESARMSGLQKHLDAGVEQPATLS